MGRGFESRLAERLVAQLDRAIMSGQHLVAVNTFQAGECWRDYNGSMEVRILPRRNPGRTSRHSRRQHQINPANAAWDYISTMALPKGPSHAFLVAGTDIKLANAGGTTSRLKGRFDSGRSSSAQAARTVVYLDRTQARMSRQHLVASTRMKPANAGGTTGRAAVFGRSVGGSIPPPGNRVAQIVSPISSPAPNTQPWRMPRGTTLPMRRSPVRIRPGLCP